MKGNIRQRKKTQAWQLTIYPGGKDSSGRPNRRYETVPGSRDDAERRMREILSTLDNGTYTPPTRYTVSDILDQWMSGYCKTNCQQRTIEGYKSVARLHLMPILGSVPLKDLRPQDIQSHYSTLCETLTNRTVLHIHRVLSQALRWAVEQDYIGRNPCDRVHPPKAEKKTVSTLSAFEVGILLREAQGSPYYPTIFTTVNTGLRRNELLALRWRDVDLDVMMSISVSRTLYKGKGKIEYKEPKTQHSRRRIAMPLKLVSYLRGYRAQKESESLHLGRLLSPDDLIFTDKKGKPIDPSVLSHNFGRIAKRLGLDAHLHSMRHTYASLMLAANVHPKIVSESLGHSNVSTTLDIYSHVTPGLQEAAAKKLDSVLPSGVICERNFERNGV